MSDHNERIAGKLRRWEKYLKNYHLPAWEEIPEFGLYMEQTIAFLEKYLDYLPPELKKEEFVSSAAINHYVRINIMPKPIKKKYYRKHLACLIMICSVKQTLSLGLVSKMIPMDAAEEELQRIYNAFVHRHRLCADYFIEQVRMVAALPLGYQTDSPYALQDAQELIAASVITAGFTRLLAEKLLLLEE